MDPLFLRFYFPIGGEHAPRTPIGSELYTYDLGGNREWTLLTPSAGSPVPPARCAYAAGPLPTPRIIHRFLIKTI